jgi:hypothetical protein
MSWSACNGGRGTDYVGCVGIMGSQRQVGIRCESGKDNQSIWFEADQTMKAHSYPTHQSPNIPDVK